MSIISEFISSVKEVVSWGNSVQEKEQTEIIAIVGELADELNRSIDLLGIYLAGINPNKDRAELVEYLRRGQDTILQSFREFQVCGGLYGLKKKFAGLFSASAASVNLFNKGTIERLIDDLAGGERMIFADLNDSFTTLRDFADRLEGAPDDITIESIHTELAAYVRVLRVDLASSKQNITNTARAIVDAI
jgi:hypothetical protein